MESFMQHILGYAITGHTREQIFVLCCGCGSNGKGEYILCAGIP